MKYLPFKYALTLMWCFLLVTLQAQKYNFVNLTVEDGLIQSQASAICEDKNHQLWIGTEGGVSKFDGKKFSGYSVQEGLITNHINLLYTDHTGNLWIGTNYGISVFNGQKFVSIYPEAGSLNNVTEFCETKNGVIMALNNFRLYRINGAKAQRMYLTPDSNETISTMLITKSGTLLASVFGKGIYAYNQRGVNRVYKTENKHAESFITQIYINSKNDTLLIMRGKLFHLHKNRISPYRFASNQGPGSAILCLSEDRYKNLWLGTEHGAYRLSANEMLHIDSRHGLTDNSVNYIFPDSENNIWFATDGDGIYRFCENSFSYFDKLSGLSNPIIMGIAQSSTGEIYTGGYGGGLYRINQLNTLQAVEDKTGLLKDKRIYCLFADTEDNVWIGTSNDGVWRYHPRKGLRPFEIKHNGIHQVRSVTCLYKDHKGNLIVGGNQGLFIIDKKNNIRKLKLPGNSIATALLAINDSLLVGTTKGLYTVTNQLNVRALTLHEVNSAYVLCLSKQDNKIWIGTTEKGVITWNTSSNEVINYTTANGLPSNFIYSLKIAKNKKTWIGTGFGICCMQTSATGEILSLNNYGHSDGLLGMECSHNCLLEAKDSSFWFGTTKGLFHFNPQIAPQNVSQPFVILKSVKLFSEEINDSSCYTGKDPWFKIPQQLKLKPNQNHVSFELGSVYYTNPEDVLFKYKLLGVDKDYATSNNPLIVYPALPPGKYVLMVNAITKKGAASLNTINYSFEIERAFYQTRWFQVLVVVLLLTTGGLIAWLLSRARQKRKQKAKEILEQIREEEFVKLRQRTAEDFHDEMGNSLTRISVLTDILKSKITSGEGELVNLVQQIKENTTSLYNGSKDIIWSLNSKNDGLFEVAEHIKEIGFELFNETTTDFNYHHNILQDKHLKLKLDYSRNLTMIFKEAYSNILKYARANHVYVTLDLLNNNQLHIEIKDDGCGFDKEKVKQGNGLKNMENRARRMNGELQLQSGNGTGTTIKIVLNNIFT